MGTDSPFWVPGEAEREARERLEDGVTGLCGDLPPGIGPLMDLAAALIHQAFTAYKSGDLAACDAFITEGQNACSGVFQMNAEYMMKFPNHTDEPAWMAFLDHLATRIDPPAPEIPRRPLPLARLSPKPTSSSGCPGSAPGLRPGMRRSLRARPMSCAPWA